MGPGLTASKQKPAQCLTRHLGNLENSLSLSLQQNICLQTDRLSKHPKHFFVCKITFLTRSRDRKECTRQCDPPFNLCPGLKSLKTLLFSRQKSQIALQTLSLAWQDVCWGSNYATCWQGSRHQQMGQQWKVRGVDEKSIWDKYSVHFVILLKH